LTRKVM